MKKLCLLFFTLCLGHASAETMSQRSGTVKKDTKVFQSTRAYNKAKEECLKKKLDLKGKKLTDCIVEYQKESK